MKWYKKRWFKGIAIVLFTIIVAMSCVINQMHFRYSDKQFLNYFKESETVGNIDYWRKGDIQIRSVFSGKKDTQSLVFLHGTPGSSKDYKKYLVDKDLGANFQIQAIDRPSYGYSNYGETLESIKEQAERISHTIESNSIIVGHSYGGPIAAALAMYYPEKVKQLILLAPAIDPYNEKQFKFNAILKAPPINSILSPAMKVAVEEKLSHEEALLGILDDWDRIKCPVTILHGKKDWIVPVVNVEFLEKKLSNTSLEIITPEDMPHIMIWTDYDVVKELILKTIH